MERSDQTDYIYYNITVPFTNGDSATPNQQICSYTTELSQPILEKSNNYYMSIVRFSVPLSSIPVLIPQVKKYQLPPNQNVLNSNVNLLDYMVAFYDVSGSAYYRSDLSYIPQNTAPQPLAPSQNNGYQQITSYYFVYSYQWFIDILNASIATAWTALRTAKPAVGTNTPYVIYDSGTQLLSMIMPYTVVTQNVRLLINFPLLNLLQAFKTQVIPVPTFFPDQTQDLFELCVTDDNITSVDWQTFAYAKPGATISTPPLFLRFNQEYVATQFWSPFYDIAFFTSTMPTNNEILQTNLQNVSSDSPNYLPILTDFNPLLDTGMRTVAQYYNSGPYRLLDLTSNEPLRKISIQIFWLNKYNQLFPLLMSNGQYFTIKIMFVRKSAYKGQVPPLRS